MSDRKKLIQKSNYVEIRNLNKDLAFDVYNLLFSIGIFHVLIFKEKKDCFNIKIFDDVRHIQFSKEYEPKPNICNNFKVASIIEKECVVIEVENFSSIILSDFTIVWGLKIKFDFKIYLHKIYNKTK